jgi:hypothetical protein
MAKLKRFRINNKKVDKIKLTSVFGFSCLFGDKIYHNIIDMYTFIVYHYMENVYILLCLMIYVVSV